TTNSRNHNFEAPFRRRLARIPRVDSVNTWLIHRIKDSGHFRQELISRDAPNMVPNTIVSGDLRSNWCFIFVSSSKLVVGKSDALEFLCARFDHQSGKRTRINASREKYAHRHVGDKVP